MFIQRIQGWVKKGITASEKSTEALREIVGGTSMMKEITSTLHKVGFWLLIFFMAGCVLGGYAIHRYQHYQMNEAVMLGGLVFDNKVFDIKRRL